MNKEKLSLILVRHGQTQWVREKKIAGWTDVPLDTKGCEQAEKLEEFLQPLVIDSVWTSDLLRCRQTAELAGFSPNITPSLREVDFGDLDGKSYDAIDASFIRGFQQITDFCPPNGEPMKAFVGRLHRFFSSLGSGDHLLFTHGGIIHACNKTLNRNVAVDPASVHHYSAEDCQMILDTFGPFADEPLYEKYVP